MLLAPGRSTRTDSASIFVGGLPATATQEELRHTFQGPDSSDDTSEPIWRGGRRIDIYPDPRTGQILNIGIVHKGFYE